MTGRRSRRFQRTTDARGRSVRARVGAAVLAAAVLLALGGYAYLAAGAGVLGAALMVWPRSDNHGDEGARSEWLRAVLRGVWAVVILFVSAVDELLTAVLGIGPLRPTLRALGRAVADEYRRGFHDAVDVEVVDDQEARRA